MGQEAVLLNGGRQLDVALTAGADEFIARLLGDAPVRPVVSTLCIVKDTAGQSSVAVLIGDRQVGFLSQPADKGLLATLEACEVHGAAARARGRMIASFDDAGKAAMTVNLAHPEYLLDMPESEAACPAVDALKPEPVWTPPPPPPQPQEPAWTPPPPPPQPQEPAWAPPPSSAQPLEQVWAPPPAPAQPVGPAPTAWPAQQAWSPEAAASPGPAQQGWSPVPPRATGVPTTGPVGVGGWLVLPVIGLIATAIGSLVQVFISLIPLFESGAWSVLTTRGTDMYSPYWAPMLIFDVFALVVTIVAPVVLLVLLFQRKRVLPKLIIGFYAFVVVWIVVDSIAIATFAMDALRQAGFFEVAETLQRESIRNLAEGLALAGIWIPYFLVSKRVKNTFVVGRRSNSPLNWVAREAPSTGKPNRTLAWVLSAVLILALAGAGAFAWKAAASSDGTSGVSASAGSTKTYTDPEYGYYFEYPADWRLWETSAFNMDAGFGDLPVDGTHVFDPRGASDGGYYLDMAEVQVYECAEVFHQSMMGELKYYYEAIIADALMLDPTAEVIEPLTETTVGGLRGFRATLTSSSDGISVVYTIYMLFQGNLEYDLYIQSSTAHWEANRARLEAFVASFRPGGLLL